MKVFSYRNIRVLILLSVLAIAAIYTQDQHINTTSWFKPIDVVIFPINGDGSIKTAKYIQQLSQKDFQDIDDFFHRGAKLYRLIVEQPIRTQLGLGIEVLPPAPPQNRNAIFDVILWSLKLRYWAYQHTPDNIANNDRIRLYVIYHQAQQGQVLAHSLGLQKGLIGIIHAFADRDQNSQNNVVMAHEVLHTVGASDKYDRYNHPVYPDGYAKPEQKPLYPQRYAEIMAGRIALSKQQTKIPTHLKFTIVGEKTAEEINWIKSQ
ncbi:hypothetical protein A9Q79_08175 [Methylophaga sp. 42_25_T18]|nr:hypothetical protein A9Q79_08175 [Methylophaga sp. 42_25_T18]